MEVLKFLSLGNNSITEAFIMLIKEQYQRANQPSLIIFTDDWFFSFAILLVAARCVNLSYLLSVFTVPWVKKTIETKVIYRKYLFIAEYF